jgi:hypothetical protein
MSQKMETPAKRSNVLPATLLVGVLVKAVALVFATAAVTVDEHSRETQGEINEWTHLGG